MIHSSLKIAKIQETISFANLTLDSALVTTPFLATTTNFVDLYGETLGLVLALHGFLDFLDEKVCGSILLSYGKDSMKIFRFSNWL